MTRARRPARSATAGGTLRRNLRRALGRDTNPLSRPVDRSRSRAWLWALLAMALASLAGAGAAAADYTTARQQSLATAARLHRVEAVVHTPARSAAAPVTGATVYEADASWTYPGDEDHTGTVTVTRRTAVGSTVSTWVDDSGRPAAAPPSVTYSATNAVLVGLAAFGGLTVLVATGLNARLAFLDRRAADSWRYSWTLFEPVWSGRARRGNQTN
ncbi:hypothetical protein [Streptomyces sp. FH025]|uniref:Rv1733c family protein n=1 Tax=Streptomyces sp. FH025 TaxID=2815937 RepID=UPI001A9FD380|nr:hypothetical protein [Streptomyces sp. FH025]MBO1413152.1 hypothetical protein [Streptomyces sp. FH025]